MQQKSRITPSQWNFVVGEREKDQRNARILLDSVSELYGPQSLEELLPRAVDRAIRVAKAQRGMLVLAGEDGDLKAMIARNAQGQDLPLDDPYSQSVVRRVWDTGEASLLRDAESEQVPLTTGSILELGLLSVMAVPMPVEDRKHGVLYVDSKQSAREFSESDLAVFQALGGLVALAIEHANLLARKTEQERMKRELLLAQQIQAGLQPTSLAQPEGFQLAALGRPCDEVSGDYYDAVPFGDGHVALIMGDVSGHGLGPAMLMASVRTLLRAMLISRPDPVDVVRSANAYLERDTPDHLFMSLFLCALMPASRQFQYVSAGHNPALLLHPDGTLEELPRTGPLLGILADAPFGLTTSRTLSPGHLLMLYTDGIFEARNAQHEMYGEDRFQESFARHAGSGASAQEVIDGVLADLKQFVGDQPLDDDVTCLVLRAI